MSSKSTFSNSTANSYATALYELAKEDSNLDKVEEGIKGLEKLLKENSEFEATILNPTVSKEDKRSIIFKIADKNNFSKLLRNFLGFVALKNRLFFLDKIIQSFLYLITSSKGELKAKVISSKKLSTEEQKKIQVQLSENFKSQLNINYEHDPSLIAGLIVQVGSMMIDTSTKTKLKKLEKVMLEA